MSTFMKVLLGIGAAVVAYKVVKPAIAQARDYSYREQMKHASMETAPGREQLDIPAGALYEPGYTPPQVNL